MTIESLYQTGPSAFSAAEIDLEELFDLKEFPIHDLDHPRRKELVKYCRQGLDDDGCSHINGFVLESALDKMRAEANELTPLAGAAEANHNPYFSNDDPEYPASHPVRRFTARTSSFITTDYLQPQSLLRKFYDCDVMVKFLSDCLNSGQIFRFADPIAACPYSIMEDGNTFPWHFDGNEFTVTLMIQEAEEGGIFEYCPGLRTPEDECFEQVQKVLDGDRQAVKQLHLKQGDLQLFKGRYSMHRVTATRSKKNRIIAIPSYVTDPYYMNRPKHNLANYGRYLPIHENRDGFRIDSLKD